MEYRLKAIRIIVLIFISQTAFGVLSFAAQDNRMEDQNEDLRYQKRSLMDQTMRIRQEKIILQHENEELKKRLKDNELEYQERLKEETRELNEKLKYTEDYLVETAEKVKLPLQERIFALEKQLDEYQSEPYKVLRLENEKLNGKLKQIQDELRAVRARKSKASEEDLKILKDSLKLKEAEIQERNEYIRDLNKSKEAVTENLRKAELKIRDLTEESNELKTEIRQLKK